MLFIVLLKLQNTLQKLCSKKKRDKLIQQETPNTKTPIHFQHSQHSERGILKEEREVPSIQQEAKEDIDVDEFVAEFMEDRDFKLGVDGRKGSDVSQDYGFDADNKSDNNLNEIQAEFAEYNPSEDNSNSYDF